MNALGMLGKFPCEITVHEYGYLLETMGTQCTFRKANKGGRAKELQNKGDEV